MYKTRTIMYRRLRPPCTLPHVHSFLYMPLSSILFPCTASCHLLAAVLARHARARPFISMFTMFTSRASGKKPAICLPPARATGVVRWSLNATGVTSRSHRLSGATGGFLPHVRDAYTGLPASFTSYFFRRHLDKVISRRVNDDLLHSRRNIASNLTPSQLKELAGSVTGRQSCPIREIGMLVRSRHSTATAAAPL